MSDDPSKPVVSVVVPLFNEEENVPILQAELTAALGGLDHEIIFVDDGSTDRTLERLTRAPEVRVLHFEKNAGQSAAIYAGANAARGATVVLIDGDLQNDPADIPRLLARDRARRRPRLRLSRAAERYPGQAPDESNRQLCAQPFHQRRRARHRVHAQGDAARMRQRAHSLQRHASLHSRTRERRRLPVGRDSGQSSRAQIRPKQIRSRQPRGSRHGRHVRRALAALAAAELQSSTRRSGGTWAPGVVVCEALLPDLIFPPILACHPRGGR